jgi:N-formylglutamate amidohydrolase
MASRHIPGVLTRHDPVGDPVALLFDSPHSGIDYPGDFRYSAPIELLRTGEDAFVHELYGEAPSRGAILIEAHFPRSYIDANRDVRDIDLSLLDAPWPGPILPTEKTRLGLGLIRRLASPGVPVYDRKLSVAEVRSRIDRYYDVYHAAMADAFADLQRRFGRVWHVDCHSMKAVGNEMSTDVGKPRPDFVLGDRDGTSCEPGFTRFVESALTAMGYSVAVNDPYKGQELIVRHTDPEAGRHSLQIEVNRMLYMDEKKVAKAMGFARLKRDLTLLIDALVGYTKSRR